MIEYQGSVFRPPSEANSLILQATLGCSYNECTFCGMYRDKRFRVRPIAELRKEIAWAAQHLGGVRKVFLADGDALVAKASFLHQVLEALHGALPNLQRVSCYASPQALAIRSVEEMRALREAGLTQYYLGIESGCDATLAYLQKGVDSAEMIRVANKAQEAEIKLSTMILLGAAGHAGSERHARESARVVNAIQPRFVSTLVMTPVEGTPLMEQYQAGQLDEWTPVELARELRVFLAHLELSGTVFRSNHASNYLALKGTLPKDQAALVAVLDKVLAHPERAPFVPEWLRAL
ncbi:MAG TPA: radical SAM protein [Planctomycetota bacterium]|nr:radical SAM protein [Planctomycetota bacterium]HPF12933.1 radical SAM protein [Planctomycetota bacterium]HRV80197.1 radical SAM protein [Planctomycetota bacterium]